MGPWTKNGFNCTTEFNKNEKITRKSWMNWQSCTMYWTHPNRPPLSVPVGWGFCKFHNGWGTCKCIHAKNTLRAYKQSRNGRESLLKLLGNGSTCLTSTRSTGCMRQIKVDKRVFRDRPNPLDKYNDQEMQKICRFSIREMSFTWDIENKTLEEQCDTARVESVCSS